MPESRARVLHRLRDEGNTIVVIEHSLDVIKTADWIIDPGTEGGQVIATDTPEDLARHSKSFTGQYLAPILERGAKSLLASGKKKRTD